MSQQIIKYSTKRRGQALPFLPYLMISELFGKTIQGEGVNSGVPSIFLRLAGCVFACSFCDSKESWKSGEAYTVEELLGLMEDAGFIEDLQNGHHLVITGGSPLKQKTVLDIFITSFIEKYRFIPYIEIENECALFPTILLENTVSCWNNSPKNEPEAKSNLKVITHMSKLKNSWFKIVVDRDFSWKEIQDRYLLSGAIQKEQLILMPKGATIEELAMNREYVVGMAIANNVRYCTREHIVLWNNKKGV